MMFIVYFLFLGCAYWFLTFPRSVGSSVLMLVSLVGGFFYILRWTVAHMMAARGFVLHELIILAVLDVLLLTAPLFMFFILSRAGKVASFLDGMAIGAFLGLGYTFLGYFHSQSSTLGPWFIWPVGSYPSFDTLVPNAGQFRSVIWNGFMAWGALIGISLVYTRRLKSFWRLWPVVPAAIVLVVFLEIMVYYLLQGQQAGPQGSFWYVLCEWFYRLDFSGRGSGFLLLVFYLGSLVLGETLYTKVLAQYPQFRLAGEPQHPGLLSELHTLQAVTRYGRKSLGAVREFFRMRRRLITVYLDKQFGRAKPATVGVEDIWNALEDRIVEKMYLAEAALAGDPVNVSDAPGIPGGWKPFCTGLVVTLISTFAYMFFVGWFGLLLTARLNNNPIGYVYATGIVTAAGYAIVYFRHTLGAWVKEVWSRFGAPVFARIRPPQKRSAKPQEDHEDALV